MPLIDSGPIDGPPGEPIGTAWVTLSPAEAAEFLAALKWEQEASSKAGNWHTHIPDDQGNELRIAIGQESP
jgi:hypothetical protein